MFKMIKLLLLAVFVTVLVCEERVEYAAVIYRHGDRTPEHSYPTDPWKNESLWPVQFGQLTNTGKQQHYALGQWLRRRYSHLLSEQYNPTEIYVKSTDVDRTLMSAQANLAGMFPPNGTSVWNLKLMWQPIPVHTVPEHDDHILAMKKPCPAYDKEYLKFLRSPEYLSRLRKYNKLMEYVTNSTGKKIKNYVDILDIYTILSIEEENNFPLPEWTHSVYPDQLREPAGYSFKIDTATPTLARLKVGPLIRTIVKSMQEVVDYKKTAKGRKPKKLSIFSGHDLTVASVLNSLDMYDGKCPVFTSTILMELIYDDYTQDHSVRISYRNTTEIVEPNVLNIPCCGAQCSLDRFKKIYNNLISVNWDYECRQSQFLGLLVMAFVIGMAMFMTIYMAHRIVIGRINREAQRAREQRERELEQQDLVNTHVVTLKVSMDCAFNQDEV